MTPFANGERPRILVLCQGTSQHGLGHVMRSRTVARCLAEDADVRVLAIGETEVLHRLLRHRNLNVHVATEQAAALELFNEWQPHAVVIDTIHFDDSIVRTMGERAWLVSLSPEFNCQRVMNSVFHRTKHINHDAAMESQVVYRGLQYTVLRESCQRITDDSYTAHVHREPLALAVSMGGVDADNHTQQVLLELSKIRTPLLIWVLLGEGYKHSYHELVSCVNQQTPHEVILAKATDSLWRILETCSLGILAGGVTSYEAAFAGLPSINLLSNTRGPILLRELVERGVALALGPNFATALGELNRHVDSFLENRAALLEMHHRSKGLIDHHGANRIAQSILQDIYAKNGYSATATSLQLFRERAA